MFRCAGFETWLIGIYHPGFDSNAAAIGHSISGIDHEVKNDLVDLDRGEIYRRNVLVEDVANFDIICKERNNDVIKLSYGVIEVQTSWIENFVPAKPVNFVYYYFTPFS